MIIKTGGIASGDGARITNYAVRRGDNEHVEVLKDENDQLLIADDFAQLKGRKHGLLHIIISPDQTLTADELRQTIEAICEEFGFNSADPETLCMHEKTDADGITRKHWHLVRPAADSATGKTYKLFRSMCKDEAISRLMELTLGHQLTSGPNNDFAEMRLREMCKDELADRLAAELGDARPRAAFSHDDHQTARRSGFDLPALRQNIKEIATLPRLEQPQALAELIDHKGLELRPAIEKGRGRSRINIELPDDLQDHNVNRTLKIGAAQVPKFIKETKEILHAIRSNSTDLRPTTEGSVESDHQRSGADTSEQHSPNSTNECPSENLASDIQKLSQEGQKLAQAAQQLQPQAARFTAARAGDLISADVEPIPDLNDPYLLRKLAEMLKRQFQKAHASLKQSTSWSS